MANVISRLSKGENVMGELKYSVAAYVGPIILCIMAVMSLFNPKSAENPDPVGSGVTLMFMACVWAAIIYWKLKSKFLVITDRRVLFASGIITKQEMDFPIRRVNSIYAKRTLLQRFLGCGTVIVTAGSDRWKFKYVANHKELARVFSEVEDTKY